MKKIQKNLKRFRDLYVLLSNVIGQLLDSNALRVLWISIYRVHVLKDLGTNLGVVDKFTCCKLLQIINRPRVHQVQERPSRSRGMMSQFAISWSVFGAT